METATQATSLQGQWTIDPIHSNLNFTVTHLVISQVSGGFDKYDGHIENLGEDLTSATFKFNIDVNSLGTNNEMRDNHLLSDDFFNAEQFPMIRFESTETVKTGEDTYEITGNLTVRDITRSATFRAQLGGTAVDGYGNVKLGLKVSTSIDRFDYGLKWNQLTEAGGMTVGKKVDINGQLQFAKQ